MEIDNKKQYKKYLLVIAVSLFIITGLTAGTYAFFNYSRIGVNQRVLTGKIKMEFAESDDGNIYLTNQFPVSDLDAVSDDEFLLGDDSDIAILNFTISGTSNTDLEYKIYGIPGTALEGKNRFDDSEINLYVEATTTDQYSDDLPYLEDGFRFNYWDEDNDEYGYSVYIEDEEEFEYTSSKFLIATGKITGTNEVHNYSLRMWVNDSVTISDTDSDASYCASSAACEVNKDDDNTNDKLIYSTMYYSLKLVVESSL